MNTLLKNNSHTEIFKKKSYSKSNTIGIPILKIKSIKNKNETLDKKTLPTKLNAIIWK